MEAEDLTITSSDAGIKSCTHTVEIYVVMCLGCKPPVRYIANFKTHPSHLSIWVQRENLYTSVLRWVKPSVGQGTQHLFTTYCCWYKAI